MGTLVGNLQISKNVSHHVTEKRIITEKKTSVAANYVMKEMRFKTIIRYHVTSSRLAKIKIPNCNYWQG